MNVKAFESVLKKCPNIKKLNVKVKANNYVLLLIGQYCTRIKSLGYRRIYPSIGEDIVLTFFRIYGHKLEELYLYESYEVTDDYLRHCTNLKILILPESSLILNEDKEFLPELEEFRSPRIYNYLKQLKNVNRLKIFSDKYSQTLKRLDIALCYLTEEELKTCIECIARFENLKELKLIFVPMKNKEPIDDCLSLIGQKCNKLLKLDLSIDHWVPISEQFFATFSEFETIEKLKIQFWYKRIMKGSIELLKHCKQLKHLDIRCEQINEDFFTNINVFVPKLQFIEITSRKNFSESFIDSFHSMKNIHKVILRVYDSKVNKYNIKNYFFGKCLSEVMLSPNGMNVKHITHNCGLNSLFNSIAGTKKSKYLGKYNR